MPNPTPPLSERHARIGRLLDELEHAATACRGFVVPIHRPQNLSAGEDVPAAVPYALSLDFMPALLAFARGEWERVGIELARLRDEQSYRHPDKDYIRNVSDRASDALSRLESALGPLLGEGGTK